MSCTAASSRFVTQCEPGPALRNSRALSAKYSSTLVYRSRWFAERLVSTPVRGLMLGVSCSWNDDTSSATHDGGVAESASSVSGVPMLPAVVARRPRLLSRWPMSAVVVVLPFVPVIAM